MYTLIFFFTKCYFIFWLFEIKIYFIIFFLNNTKKRMPTFTSKHPLIKIKDIKKNLIL